MDDEFFIPFASAQAWQTMRRAARKLVNRYVTDFANNLARVWAVERPFALHIEDGIVSGRADVILDKESGRAGALAIVDYKVAADEARAPRYEEQLRIYSLAGRGEGLTVEAAYLPRIARRQSGRQSISGTMPTGQALTTVRRRLSALRKSQFDPKPDTDRCGRCESASLRTRTGWRAT